MATTKFTEKDRYGNLKSLEIKTDGNNLEVPPMASGIPVQYEARGGDAETHPGGPKGSDTVPAWLTPGEFVVNKEATDLFGPQIEQMNAIGQEIQDGNMNPNNVPQPWNMEMPTYASQGIRAGNYNKDIWKNQGLTPIENLSKRFGYDIDEEKLLEALAWIESRGGQDTSKPNSSAVGPFQILKGTAKNIGSPDWGYYQLPLDDRLNYDKSADWVLNNLYVMAGRNPEWNLNDLIQSHIAGETGVRSIKDRADGDMKKFSAWNAIKKPPGSSPYDKMNFPHKWKMKYDSLINNKDEWDPYITVPGGPPNKDGKPTDIINWKNPFYSGYAEGPKSKPEYPPYIPGTNILTGSGADIPSGNMPKPGVFSKIRDKVTDAWENLRWNEGGEIPPAYLNHGGIHLGQPSTWIPGFSGNAPMPTPYDIPSEDELEKAAWLYKKRMQNEESMRELQNAPPMEDIIAQQYADANLGMGAVPPPEVEEEIPIPISELYRSADTPAPNYGVPPTSAIVNPMQDYYNQLAEQEVEGSDTVAGIPLASIQALDTLTSNADGTFTYNTITYRDNGYGQLIDRYGHPAPHNVQLLYKAKQGDVGGLEQNQNILNDLTKRKEELNKKKEAFVNKHGEAIISGNLAPNLEKEWQAIEAEEALLNDSTSNLEAKAQNNEATDAAANRKAYENYVADMERFGMPILSFEDWIGRDDTPEKTTSILNEDGEVVVPDTIKSTEIKEKKLEKLANQVEDAKLEKMYRHLNRMKSKIDEIYNAGSANPRWEQTKGMLNFLFGDLIDGREIGRAIAIYLGSRALGYNHNDTIGFVAKQYLERVDTKNAQLDKFIRDNADKFTQESLAEYKRTKGRSKLIPIGKAPRYQGNSKMHYSKEYPNGRWAYEMKHENADGKDVTYWSYSKTGDMPVSAYSSDVHTDASRIPGTDEYEAKLMPRVNQIVKILEGQMKKSGDKVKTGVDKWKQPEWKQWTALDPTAAGWSIARWAEENGFRLQELNQGLPQAYSLMVQDTKRKAEEDKNYTKPSDIIPYLEDSMIKPLLTSRAAELVTANVNNEVVSTDVEKLKEINRKANQLAKQIGATTTRFWNEVMREWINIENDQYRDTSMTHKQEYIKEYDKKKDKGLTPFALFAQDYIDLKFIKINEEKS
tara:strand:+ start:198 stop:3635 length:3438 start_codon:yes stop_codon:yes gene_type:complete